MELLYNLSRVPLDHRDSITTYIWTELLRINFISRPTYPRLLVLVVDDNICTYSYTTAKEEVFKQNCRTKKSQGFYYLFMTSGMGRDDTSSTIAIWSRRRCWSAMSRTAVVKGQPGATLQLQRIACRFNSRNGRPEPAANEIPNIYDDPGIGVHL